MLICTRVSEEFTKGLLIVFKGMTVSGKTKIRSYQVKNLKVCQHIIGGDSNSLYLASISENCPTGFFVYSQKYKIFLQSPASSMSHHSALANLHLCPKETISSSICLT